MWIFTHNAFLSIVAHRAKPSVLLVRARFDGDLQRVFPHLADKVERTEVADYLFRLEVPRAQVAKVIADSLKGIDYDNFKNAANSMPRHDVYLDVWHVMAGAQRKYERKRGWL